MSQRGVALIAGLALLAALSGLYLIAVTSWRHEARRLMKRN